MHIDRILKSLSLHKPRPHTPAFRIAREERETGGREDGERNSDERDDSCCNECRHAGRRDHERRGGERSRADTRTDDGVGEQDNKDASALVPGDDHDDEADGDHNKPERERDARSTGLNHSACERRNDDEHQ